MVLDKADCEELFARLNLGKDVLLESFHLEPFTKEILGYLGEHLRLTLNASNGQNTSLFVKVVAEQKGMLTCFKDIPIFKKEQFTYDIIKRAKDTLKIDTSIVPNLLLSKTMPNGHKVMVFENLQLQGYEVPKQHKLTEDEIIAGLKALAKFHTISIAWEVLAKQNITPKCPKEAQTYLHPFFPNTDKSSSGYKYIMASQDGMLELAKLLRPEDIALPSRIRESCKWTLDVLNDGNSWRKVLCQGDLWGFNLMFKYGEKIDAKVLDFQMCRYAPPAHDVTMLIYMATDASLRRRCIEKFYDCYYTALTESLSDLELNINEILPKSEYQETCKVYMKVAKFIWLVYRQTSEQSHDNAIAMQRNHEYMVKLVTGSERPAHIRRLFEIDQPYKKGITQIFSEYVESLTCDPLSIEEIYQIVGRKLTKTYGYIPDFELIDAQSKEITKVAGYLGNYHQLTLHVKVFSKNVEEIEMKLFAKMLPKTDALKEFHNETNCGFKESQFYSAILSKMASFGLYEIQDAIATCYLVTPAGLIFDDLVAGFGYRMGRVRESMRVEDVRLALKALAKLHASGLILEAKTGRKLPEMYATEFQETFYNEKGMSVNLLKAGKLGICMGIDLFYSSHHSKDKLTPDAETLKKHVCKAIDKFRGLIQPSPKFRNTICHGDLWASNLMFNSSRCKIIDFQSYRYAPCTHDLTQFLHLAMFSSDRKYHWQEMIKFYYKEFEAAFARHGCNVDDFMPYESFLKSVLVEEEFALYQSLTHCQTTMLTSESLQALFADAEKSRVYIFEDRSEHVRHHWQNDPVYRQRLGEAINDFREYCLKHCIN